jgi:hypothetical protein
MLMMSRSGAVLLLAIALPAGPTAAATMPAIKAGTDNQVPACTTPGRLTAYLKWRNPSLEQRFQAVPTAYMRYGEELGVRWDYAFFQMVLETGGLTFKRDVKPSQNNFAGLGATGNGEPGESFPDIAAGVKAHLQHVLMYAGDRIAEPTAERTRKVQDWGVLTSWHKGFKQPITYTDLARKWAPGANSYAATLESVGKRFYDEFCNKPDPEPELVAEARQGRAQVAQTADGSHSAEPERVSGVELARQALERARQQGDATRSGLGFNIGAGTAADVSDAPAARESRTVAAMTRPPAGKAPKARGADAAADTIERPAAVQTASAAAAAAQALAPKAPPSANCRVWTASYGGLKSIIIRSSSGQQVNYTVLDVNEGAEAREFEAYVAAYAKGGQKVGEFGSQAQALEQAFQLCPEG